jgi:hypothetical protein
MRPVTPLALIVVLASACTEDPATTTDGASSSGSSTGNVATTDPSTDPTVAPTTDPTTGDPSGSTAAPTTGVGTTTVDTTGDTGDTTGDTTSPVDSSTGDSTSGSSTGESTGSTGMVDLCANGELDQDETDIDCGGATCAGCQDGQVCLANEDCVSVVCTGGLCVTPECLADADCAGLDDACNTGTCDLVAFACVKTPAMDATMCDDGDLCTGASACLAGACVGSDLTDCSGLNSLCGTGVCDPLTGTCGVEPDKDAEGMACDDQNNCTANTVCTAGSCGDPNNKGYAFYEPFLDNSAAWTLPESWEIKAAAVSPGGWNGADPAMDHTATDDNGVAGQFVGGLVTSNNTTTGQANCLTSPKIDTSLMPTVWWTFWRHLHTDYTNYAVSTVEVFNGNIWTTLQSGYASPGINDPDWTEHKFDISAHKSANMQVRICHTRNGGAFDHGGWSVDDVTISPVSCTP